MEKNNPHPLSLFVEENKNYVVQRKEGEYFVADLSTNSELIRFCKLTGDILKIDLISTSRHELIRMTNHYHDAYEYNHGHKTINPAKLQHGLELSFPVIVAMFALLPRNYAIALPSKPDLAKRFFNETNVLIRLNNLYHPFFTEFEIARDYDHYLTDYEVYVIKKQKIRLTPAEQFEMNRTSEIL
jgi:hypothetical protein